MALLGNAFLVVLLPALTFAISKPAFGCKTAGIAAFFCALDPGLYYFALGEAMSEPLFAVLLCAAIAIWQRAQPLHSHQSSTPELTFADAGTTRPLALPETRTTFIFALAAGVLFGAASLTRPGFLGLPLFISFVDFLVRRNNQSFSKAIVLCLAFVLTLSPWAIRNRAVMGTVLFSSTNDGRTLLGSVLAAKLHRGDWHNPEFIGPEYARVGQMANGIERNRAETRLAIAELKGISLVTLVEVAAKRVLRLWVPLNRIVSDKAGIKANLAVNLLYFPSMLLAAFGLWRARHNPAIVPLWTTFLYVTLLSALSWGGTRLRYPVEPFLAVFAAHGLFEIYKFFSTNAVSAC